MFARLLFFVVKFRLQFFYHNCIPFRSPTRVTLFLTALAPAPTPSKTFRRLRL